MKLYAGGLIRVGLLVLAATPASAQALDNSAIEQQHGAIQDQITQGINNGTLSADQIEALQAEQAQLQAQRAVAPGAAVPDVSVSPPTPTIAPTGAIGAPSPSRAPTTTQTSTGPDPFTYNSLGPDAYQSQKYQNPAYNVPSYPTTNPQAAGTQQQYSGPSSGAPYGAGYAQAPSAGGAAPQVYVYHPSMSR